MRIIKESATTLTHWLKQKSSICQNPSPMKTQNMLKYQQSIDVNPSLVNPQNMIKYQQWIDVWVESISHESHEYDKISTIN